MDLEPKAKELIAVAVNALRVKYFDITLFPVYYYHNIYLLIDEKFDVIKFKFR